MIVPKYGHFGRPAYNLRRFPHLDGFGRPAYNLRRFPHLGADDGFVIPIELPTLAELIPNSWARSAGADGLDRAGGAKGFDDVRVWVEELNSYPGAPEFEAVRTTVLNYVEQLKEAAANFASAYEWDTVTGRSDARTAQLNDAYRKFFAKLAEGVNPGKVYSAFYNAKVAYLTRLDRDAFNAEQAVRDAQNAERAAKTAADKAAYQAKVDAAKSRSMTAQGAIAAAQSKLALAQKKIAAPRIFGIPVSIALPVGAALGALFVGGAILRMKRKSAPVPA